MKKWMICLALLLVAGVLAACGASGAPVDPKPAASVASQPAESKAAAAVSQPAESAAADEEPATDEEAAASTASGTNENGVSADFKATMDAYEVFFTEYTQFMEEYADAETVDAEMLADYADLMTRYTETMQALDALDESTLSDADLGYYTEVMGRINTLLAVVEVAA